MWRDKSAMFLCVRPAPCRLVHVVVVTFDRCRVLWWSYIHSCTRELGKNRTKYQRCQRDHVKGREKLCTSRLRGSLSDWRNFSFIKFIPPVVDLSRGIQDRIRKIEKDRRNGEFLQSLFEPKNRKVGNWNNVQVWFTKKSLWRLDYTRS